ncbi:cytochrome b reductase 1 [Nilaparvata lugens]|uniref:cytochrome b reductase 1 n=1 Tax=Nilaparvata lugens TaxID=108931 RepID=UPI00193E042F|nr:cytochrome b reductase 1 [Nilaparvata lugens]
MEEGEGGANPVAPMAEFDKTPPEEGSQGTIPLDDLPPPPLPHSAGTTAISINESQSAPDSAASNESKQEKKKRKEKEAKEKQYQSDYDSGEDDMSCGRWCEYVLVVVLASLLLLSALILVLFWTLYYRKGYAWQESPEHQFNLHPTLMVAGFISFSGFSMLLYRISRCCRQIYVKLFHMLFHALAIPCIVIGFIAVWDSKNLSVPPIKNFYSMHSWMGLITMGLFALQFVVTTFMLAVATCLTGLTQKAILQFGKDYAIWPEESIIMNALAMVLVALGILVSYAVRRDSFGRRPGQSQDGGKLISERL